MSSTTECVDPPRPRSSLRDCIGDGYYMVLEYLGTYDRTDVAPLTRVSRVSRAETEPYMYNTICFRSFNYSRRPPRLWLLIRTLIQRTELADHIRHLDMRGNLNDREYAKIEVPHVTDSEVAELQALIGVSGLPRDEIDSWSRCLYKRSLAAFGCFLISRLHNLVSFKAGDRFRWHTRHLGALLSSAACHANKNNSNVSTFRHLETLDFYKKHCEADIAKVLLPIMYFPELRTFKAGLESPKALIWPTVPPKAWDLTTLSLSEIHESLLGELLSCTPNLKNLSWRWKTEFGRVQDEDINFDVLGAALQHVRGTLRTLRIETDWVCNPFNWYETKGTLQSLYSFEHLEHVEAPVGFLGTGEFEIWDRVLNECIPKNIRTLRMCVMAYLTEEQDGWEKPEDNDDTGLEEDEDGRVGDKTNTIPEKSLLRAIEDVCSRRASSHPRLESLTCFLPRCEVEAKMARRDAVIQYGQSLGVAVKLAR